MVPRAGLQLPRQLPFDKWLSIGRDLAVTASSSAWCLGDWLNYGKSCFEGRYRSAIEQSSLEYKTLRNYAWVARRFALHRRRESLSFGHHAEIAALSEPEQEFWLRKAEALSWSRNDLRREVQVSLRERERQETDVASDCAMQPAPEGPAAERLDADRTGGTEERAQSLEELQVKVTTEQLEAIRLAASSARLSVDVWVAMTLQEATRSAMGAVDSPAGYRDHDSIRVCRV